MRLLSSLLWVVASIKPAEMSAPNVRVMEAVNATLDESPTRLKVGFITPRVDRGLDIGGEC